MPGPSVSSACLLRQVSSGLSRNCRNERRPGKTAPGTCHRSRVPVLAIAAQTPGKEIGSGYFQETHPDRLFEQCSHYCELVSDPEQMPRGLEIGIHTAISRGGVSVIRSYDEVDQILARQRSLLSGPLLAVGLQLEQRKRWLQH